MPAPSRLDLQKELHELRAQVDSIREVLESELEPEDALEEIDVILAGDDDEDEE